MHQPWECCDGPKKGTVSQGSMVGCYSLVGREQSSVPGACTWFPAMARAGQRRIGKEQLGTSSKGGVHGSYMGQAWLHCMGGQGGTFPCRHQLVTQHTGAALALGISAWALFLLAQGARLAAQAPAWLLVATQSQTTPIPFAISAFQRMPEDQGSQTPNPF